MKCKKFYLSLVLLFVLPKLSYSQNGAFNYIDFIDSVFAGLDSQYMSQKILIDKTPLKDVVQNYAAINDSTVDFNQWYSLYKAIMISSYDRDDFWSYDQFQDTMLEAKRNKVIPIFILNYKYNQIKSNAISSNLIDTTGGLYVDVLPRGTNPYNEGRLYAAAPMFMTSNETTLKFVLRSDFYFTNDPTSVVGVKINFMDGNGMATRHFGDTITVTYSSGFWKTLRIRTALTGMVELRSESPFSAKTTATCLTVDFELDDEGFFEGTIPYKEGEGGEKDEDDDDGLTRLRADLTYGYTDEVKHTTIKKPLLLIEGFDGGYATYPTDDYDCKYGSLGWVDVYSGLKVNLEKMDYSNPYPEFDKGDELAAALWDEGYDIFYVDFFDGTEYMQRNAFALIELINWINDNKDSDEEITIVGASMGGQVARYALDYMETHDMKHCVRLLNEFDSPAIGANISIGLQAFVTFMNEVAGDVKTEYQRELLSRPATKQLVIWNYYEGDDGERYDELRTEFHEELDEMGGYPQYTRKVAITNGNKNAFPIPDADDIESDPLILDVNILSGLIANAKAAYLPGIEDGANNFIFEGSSPLLGIFSYESFPAAYADTVTRYDTGPGSMRGGLQSLDDDLGFFAALFSSWDIPHDAFCFVPTISALDIYGTNDLYYNLSTLDEDVPNPSVFPFDAYHSPTTDNTQAHVQITDENIDWLIDELKNNIYSLPTALPALAGDVFNFGNYVQKSLKSIEINEDGVLQINGSFLTGFLGTAPYDITPSDGSSYTVHTSDCGAVVNINYRGVLELGDDNTPDENIGILEVLTDGIINVNDGGTLKINKNSVLHLRNASQLQLMEGGSIEIEDGGYISIDNGGVFNINDNDVTLLLNGAGSAILVQTGGTLSTESAVDLTFTGDGHIEYYEDGIVDIGSGGKFILAGTGTTDIKLKVKDNADLYIPSHNIDFQDCSIWYSAGAQFRVAFSNVLIDNVFFDDITAGDAGIAVFAHNTNDFLASYSEFSGFSEALKFEEIDVCPGDVNVVVTTSQIYGHTDVGIEAYDVDRMRLDQCHIEGSEGNVAGLFLQQVTECTVVGCNIEDYDGEGDNYAGIYADKVNYLIIDGGAVQDCDEDGIEAYNTNIILRNQAQIKNNGNGILATSHAWSSTSYPAIENRIVAGDIGCAWIIDNETGIAGNDITLEIDQYLHSVDGFDIHPNRFDNNANKIFDICYDHYSISDDILAEGNYWGSTGPTSGDYDIGPTGSSCTGIDLAYNYIGLTVFDEPEDCQCMNTDCEETDEENIQARMAEADCDSINKQGGGKITIGDQYRLGFAQYIAGNYDSAYVAFNWLKTRIAAEYPNRSLTGDMCVALELASDWYTDGINILATVYCIPPYYSREAMSFIQDGETFILYPNPAQDILTISANDHQQYLYTVIDVAGNKLLSGDLLWTTSIDVSDLPKGIYLMRIMKEEKVVETKKFIIQ